MPPVYAWQHICNGNLEIKSNGVITRYKYVFAFTLFMLGSEA